jgi:hypothetical protein
MNSLLGARAKIALCAFVAGAAIAFLAYTSLGLIVLAISLVVAAVAALWLWRARPNLFVSPSEPAERPAAPAQDAAPARHEPEPARWR